MPLANIPPISPPRVPVQTQIRKLEASELALLKPVTSPGQYQTFEHYLSQGFTCYAAEVEGQIAGYNWYTDRPYVSRSSRIVFPLNRDELFLVYSHTLRAWRGRGVDVALKAAVFRRYQDAGVRAIRTSIDDDNRSSMRTMSRWHATPVRRYRYRRFLGWRRVRCESVADKPGLLEELIGRPPKPHVALQTAPLKSKQEDVSHARV